MAVCVDGHVLSLHINIQEPKYGSGREQHGITPDVIQRMQQESYVLLLEGGALCMPCVSLM